jgi:subtilisin family serine protease
MARRRRINDFIDGPSPSVGSVFGPDEDNAVPGQVVMALHADTAASLEVSVPSGPMRGLAAVEEFSVRKLGATAVDNALARLEVKGISRLHGATPPDVFAGIAMATDYGLDGTFQVQYGAATKPEAVAERLNKLDEVEWAEPVRYREASLIPNDPMFGQQWGLTRIGCPDAWDRTTGSPSVTVAVIDTGVDLNHPELAPLIVAGQDLVDWRPGDIPKQGWVFEGDFVGVDADPQDEVGHGTHVAGTIACVSNTGAGVTGVTWNARLMPVRVLARIRETATGRVSGTGSSANIAAGIRWAADHGAQIINMSLGGYGDARVEREAIAYAIARGVVVVAAMGNDNTNKPSYPAAYPDVIAVAATDSVDHRASFSNTGSWIDVSAPGVGILSTYWDNTYKSLDGTSMASPHVAGVAALIMSVAPNTSAAQVATILRSTAKPLRDAPSDPVPNDRYGHGLLQAAAAVAAAAPPLRSAAAICRSVSAACSSVTCPSVAPCPSRTVVCRSQNVACWPSALCVSRPPQCPPTRSVAGPCFSVAMCPSVGGCPSVACASMACGVHGPVGPAEAGFEGYDPYGYDPYSADYR